MNSIGAKLEVVGDEFEKVPTVGVTVIDAAQFERLSFPCDFNNMIGLDRAVLAPERPHLYFFDERRLISGG